MHAYLIINSDETKRKEMIDTRLTERGISPFDRSIARGEGETSIGISDIRKFIHSLSLQPMHGKELAGIIYDAVLLTTESQQALLKTLEEPPKNTVIYIGIQNASFLLPTILSRCECIYGTTVATVDDGETIRSDIQSLFSMKTGEIIHKLSTIGKTKDDLATWLDRAILILREDVLEDAHGRQDPYASKKQHLLRALLHAKQYQKNNVSLQLLVEHAVLESHGENEGEEPRQAS